jgi:hypothetical protein
MRWRTLSFTLCSLVSFLVTGVSFAAPKYPMVMEMQGKVRWTDKDKKDGKLKAKHVLIEQASLETGDKSQVLVKIDESRTLRLLANSRVEFPSISWETGDTPVILLKYGSIRWLEFAGKKYNIALRSDLFEFISPVGDVVLTYDPKTAMAEVKVIKGSMEFAAMNAEDSALVASGQKVSFQGVRENDEIVYDVLLKGKKIPRGKLGLVQPFSAEEKNLYSEVRLKKEAEVLRQKEVAEKKAHEKTHDKNAICSAPEGRLNQCAWVCENNPKKEKETCQQEREGVQCLRKRCNANGEWAEPTLVPKDKTRSLCGVHPVVKECDY